MSSWDNKGILVKTEEMKLSHAVFSALYSMKIKHVEKMSHSNREAIKNEAAKGNDVTGLLEYQMKLDKIRASLSEYLSIVVM